MKLKITWKNLNLKNDIEKLDKNIIKLEENCYHKCIKCKGSGNVPWGVCYSCNGYGIDFIENIITYNKRIDNYNKSLEKYYNSETYLNEEKLNTFLSLIKELEENDIVNEWERNFCNNIYGKQSLNVSFKQKEILLKISKKVHCESKNLKFKAYFN